jgi:hypothetical protein
MEKWCRVQEAAPLDHTYCAVMMFDVFTYKLYHLFSIKNDC